MGGQSGGHSVGRGPEWGWGGDQNGGRVGEAPIWYHISLSGIPYPYLVLHLPYLVHPPVW